MSLAELKQIKEHVAGYMPYRGEFDTEWDNEAEQLITEISFSPDDKPETLRTCC